MTDEDEKTARKMLRSAADSIKKGHRQLGIDLLELVKMTYPNSQVCSEAVKALRRARRK